MLANFWGSYICLFGLQFSGLKPVVEVMDTPTPDPPATPLHTDTHSQMQNYT